MFVLQATTGSCFEGVEWESRRWGNGPGCQLRPGSIEINTNGEDESENACAVSCTVTHYDYVLCSRKGIRWEQEVKASLILDGELTPQKINSLQIVNFSWCQSRMGAWWPWRALNYIHIFPHLWHGKCRLIHCKFHLVNLHHHWKKTDYTDDRVPLCSTLGFLKTNWSAFDHIYRVKRSVLLI